MHRTSMELEDWRVTTAADITNSGCCEHRKTWVVTRESRGSSETVSKLKFSSLKFPYFSRAGERWKPQSEHPRIRPDTVHGKSRKKQKHNPTRATAQKNNRRRRLEVNPGTSGSSFASTPRFSTFSPPEARDQAREWPPGQYCGFLAESCDLRRLSRRILFSETLVRLWFAPVALDLLRMRWACGCQIESP